MLDLINVSYDTLIPNNVGLSEDKRVLKALEKWHPGYINWWNDLIPERFQLSDVYLRTAVSVDPKGWAKFDYVKMPEYRWGIFLAPSEGERQIHFGDHIGTAAWDQVPGELAGIPVWFISRDCLLRNKRATGRPKDLGDAEELELIGE